MKRQLLSIQRDGFYGAYYSNPQDSPAAFIAMIGPSCENRLAHAGVRWLQERGCNVLMMAPVPPDHSYHNFPLESFGKAIRWLKEQGNTKIGIAGGSITAAMALLAASHYEDITFTLAVTPCDFVPQGYLRDHLDKAGERPAEGEAMASLAGKALPFLPYAYPHPQYWEKLMEEAKASGNRIASREMFQESERLHPLTEEEMIPVERIMGRILLVGAEDDCLWDACGYIRRMQQRLEHRPHKSICRSLIYEHGTHFVFPQGMLDYALPGVSGLAVRFLFREGRKYPRECRAVREDIERKAGAAVGTWAHS